MSKNDGGPAYPSGESWISTDLSGMETKHARGSLHNGMSLREHFAGQALAGPCAGMMLVCSDGEIAARAYAIADAMLAERDKNDDT